ncbi:MAG TPA: SUMF1/EgtB/PvdO family nonheme iron enzyme [Spirochaetia bacterium]|jgi:formylglycine-generating enzyme required for sulfatase activity|nr:SUMF1/EgtB/PvdO family nonheme iron enzyme [Spirochaetia bacterium]
MAKKKAEATTPQVSVSLKPFFGMKPGLYMLILYITVILVLFFFVFLFPGLRKNGTYVTYTTDPSGAAIFIDDQYRGSSPCEIFIPSGTHTLKITHPYSESQSDSITVKGRLFASLFFPRRETVHTRLTTTDFAGFLKASLSDFAEWSQTDTLYSTYQAPMVLSKAAEVYALELHETSTEKTMYDFLYTAIRYVNNEYLLKDYIYAVARTESHGGVFSAEAILDIVSKIIQGQPSARDLVLFLHSVPGKDIESSIILQNLFSRVTAEYTDELKNVTETHVDPSGTRIDIAGVVFHLVPSGMFIMGKQANAGFNPALFGTRYQPVVRSVNEFFMQEREVTNRQFGMFLSENPEWNIAAKEKLIRAGLVTEDYLSAYDPNAPDIPVTHVSYHAAKAYCSWFQTKLPALMQGFTVSLPTEAEWEWVARNNLDASVFLASGITGPASVFGRPAGRLGLYDLSGNVMEWCEDWYQPNAYIFSSLPAPFDAGAEKCVRGGSWAISMDRYNLLLRGSQPQAFCTPFLGFRPVIVKARSE